MVIATTVTTRPQRVLVRFSLRRFVITDDERATMPLQLKMARSQAEKLEKRLVDSKIRRTQSRYDDGL